jgi:hypothetical protein
VVLVTCLISYVLQINAIIAGEPLYIIALYTLLPWLPVIFIEGLWKVKNYTVIAALGLFTILQLGHFSEHLIQVLQLDLWNGTVACPPPLDNIGNASRAIANGLRESTLEPTMYSVETIIKPGLDGLPIFGLDGKPLSGPAACAIFGQLDLEIVHLIWELVGLLGTAGCLYFFRQNVFLWIAFACLCWHALEHMTISYFYYFDQEAVWSGVRQLWATYPETGNSFVAHPVGKEPSMLNFYEAGGKFGLMARFGMFEQLTGFTSMPGRAQLHMGYNLAITVPTVLAFLQEATLIRNQYLERSFSKMSHKELSDLTLKLESVKFKKGQKVFSQGDIAEKCYVITKGSVTVIIENEGADIRSVAKLTTGQLFGEMGLIDGQPAVRTATIQAEEDLECLEINKDIFSTLINKNNDEPNETRADIMKLAANRLTELNLSSDT